jgi:hypothetical protein
VVGDDLAGVLFGGLVVAEPGVAGRGVEDPLCVIEDEVVLGVFGPGELLQQFGSAVEAGADLTALAEPGPAACSCRTSWTMAWLTPASCCPARE